MSSLLAVENLTVDYKAFGRPDFHAVKGVSFTVEKGETVGLVGESGCGKSTIAKAICGLVKPAGGSIDFAGHQVRPLTNRRRSLELSRIQMVFQDPYNSLNPRRRVGAQIADGVELGKRLGKAQASKPAEASVADWLRRVELDPAVASSFPHQFSGGQRQRIAIARSLAAQPQLLIGDEPISALDASLQAQIADLMRVLAREVQAGMLFISHDLAVVRLIADRILVMKDGLIVESGPTDEVWNRPKNPYTELLLSSIPLPDGLGNLPGVPASAIAAE
jgi:oligopeptide transport system ATP-binding protein